MADSENSKQSNAFEVQHNATGPDSSPEYAEVTEVESPPNKDGTEDGNKIQSSDEELQTVALNEENSKPQKDNDSVKIPMDTSEMESVDLKSVEEVKTDQPKSGRSSKASKKKKEKKFYSGVDYVNRDPENLQEAVKVNFADIIAEPSGAHSFNTIWGSSYKVYSITKFWIYRVLTLICGVPCALFWGIYFACLAFFGIWWIMPCLRAIRIKLSFVGQLWSLCIRTWLDPVFESIGLILSRIRVMLTLRRD